MITGPHHATVADYEAIVRNANACFTQVSDAGGVVACWPQSYVRDAAHLHRFLIFKEEDRVVSSAVYVDQTLMVDGFGIRVAGVGEVATHPEYRGRSLMSQLLKCAIECMTEEGYAFSDLSGDRQRYGRFGWECGGREWLFTVTLRSLARIPAREEYEAREYRALPGEIDATHAVHEAEPRRIKRTRAQHERLMGRHGRLVLLARRRGDVAAYLVSQPGKDHVTVNEFGGEAKGVCRLLGCLLERDARALTVPAPWAHPLNETLSQVSAHWQLAPTRMFRILSLRATLRGFARQMGDRYRALCFRGERRLTLGSAETGEAVGLVFSEVGVEVCDRDEKSPTLWLSPHGMVRFLFGPMEPGAVATLPPELTFLSAILPVDFTIGHNDAV